MKNTMTTAELRADISRIIGRPVTLKLRKGVTRIGETHCHFVALYGDITLAGRDGQEPMFLTNDSLAYDMDSKEMVMKLTEAGLSARTIYGGNKSMPELLVCVDRLYRGDSRDRYYVYNNRYDMSCVNRRFTPLTGLKVVNVDR